MHACHGADASPAKMLRRWMMRMRSRAGGRGALEVFRWKLQDDLSAGEGGGGGGGGVLGGDLYSRLMGV
jgi:hypothetical protein